ncbi:hypothetical protein ACODT5_40320 [Streptomyces sp. 5.8]
MTTQPTPEDPVWEAKRRRAGVVVSLAVGGLARWAWRSHMTRKHTALE